MDMFDAVKIKDQLVEWIRKYFLDNGSSETKAIIGVSGGKDSSVVAALCVSAIGKERVLGVLMPQGRQRDIDVAYELCKELGIEYLEINIQNTVQTLYDVIEKTGLKLDNDAILNTPARVRMTTLYAISAIIGGRVANTCNLSENWVGYATKFGDAAGDFSPLANMTVTEVVAVGRAIGLASKFIDKTPADGLCGKTDEDNLGFTYKTLDMYIRDGRIDNYGGDTETNRIKAKIDRLHENNLHKMNPTPAFLPL